MIPPIHDYNLAGLVGGAPSAILVEPSPELAGWVAKWSLIDPAPTDIPIWRVVYQLEPGFGSLAIRAPHLVDTAEALESALRDVADFSVEHDLNYWTEWFVEAQQLLHHPEPAIPGYSDLLPDAGYALPARQVLAACARAWVFGAMGWWNDMGFDDPNSQSKYDQVTDQLWVAVIKGLSAAANAFDPSAG